MHGKSFPSWRISEICSLEARGVAGLWSLLLSPASAWVRSSVSSPSSSLWSVWAPQEPSPTKAQGVMETMATLTKDYAFWGARTHPSRRLGRSRCSCPRCWCRWRSLGTLSPVHTRQYLLRQCSMAPGQIPQPGSHEHPRFLEATPSPHHLSSAAHHRSGQLGRGRSQYPSHSPHQESIPGRRGPEGPGRKDLSSRRHTCRLPAGKGTVTPV